MEPLSETLELTIIQIGKENKTGISLRRRLTTGTIWNLIATTFNQGSIFACNVLVARILGKHAFGEYSIVISTLITVAALIQLSMGYTATKYVAEFRSIDKDKTGRILGLCSIIALCTAILGTFLLIPASPFIATHAMKAPHLSDALVIGTGYLFFSAINGYQIGAFAGLEAYNSLAKTAILSGIISVLGIAVGAWYFQLSGALAGLSVTAMIRCIVHYYGLKMELEKNGLLVTYKGLNQELNIFRTFALPAALSGYVSLPAMWYGNTILIRQQGGIEQMALYNAAISFRMLVMFLPVVINNVGMPILNNYKGLGNAERYWKTFRITLSINASAVMLISLVLIISGPILFNLFGKDFGGGFPVLKVLLIAAIIEGVSISTYQIIQSHAKIWQSFMCIAVPYCILFVISAHYLAPIYGAVGLAAAYTIGWSLNLLATCILAFKVNKVSKWPQEKVV